jgi:hypothetical protein
MVDAYQGARQPKRLSAYQLKKLKEKLLTSYAYADKIKTIEKNKYDNEKRSAEQELEESLNHLFN